MNEGKNSRRHESAKKNQSKHKGGIFALLLSPNVRFSIVTILLLAAIGWLGLTTVEKEMKRNLAAQLQTTLAANVEALKIWIEDQKVDAQVLASQPEILKKILSLIELSKNEDLQPEYLQKTQELIWLREHLGAACKKYGFIGFVLLDSTGFQVGALLDEPVGRRQLIEKSVFFYRSLQGDTVVSHPFIGEIELPDIHGVWRKNWPTMFTSTPISNDAGEIVGVLSFRIRPEIAFTRMLEISRWGETGETYAFDSDALMLSDSRFTPQLKKAGLLPDQSGSRAILQMQIRDPGELVEEGFRPMLPPSSQPLTLMAESAIKGETGVNVDGYNDYRGVPVVGAWAWLPDHYFGVATEMEVEEAFAPLQTMIYWFALIFGLFALSTLSAFLFHIRQVRSEKERQSAMQRITESEIRFRAIMDNAGDAIITIDETGSVETFNPAAEKIFAYRAKEVIGHNIKILMPEPYRSEHDGYLQRYLSTGTSRVLELNREVQGKRKSGDIFDLEISVRKMALAGKTRFIGTLKDITERKNAETKLKTYAVELEQSNRELQDFTAIASHDLQEPLRKIIIFGDRLETRISDLDPQGLDTLRRMQKSAERMKRFIEDLLEYSKVTNKTKELTSIDLNKLVPKVVEDLDLIIKKNAGKVFMGHLPTIEGDVVQIRQLFQNLFTNALKYHETNVPPVIKIRCSAKEEAFFHVTVEDNGIGFDEKYVTKIFKPFERLHTQEYYEGTGMGLAICQKIVNQHGGKIAVKSKPSHGTTFTVTLPALNTSAPKQKPKFV
jgi:two-component system, LuxR family, sensor kinase FixL